MKKRRSVAIVAALFAVALSPTVAMGHLHLPSEPSTALPDESESAFEGSNNANLFTSEGGDVAAESVATALEGEAQKMPEVEYDFIAGYFLDDSGNLIARKYADEANGDVRDGNGSKIEVLDSEYSKEDIDFIHSKLSELAKAPGSSGFIAEYDARKDLFVIVGKVDRGVAFQLLGDVKYSIVDGERVERFSR
ncbi:hypothetical protein [Buchananella felis]|uniref:hypothetical protein n=1 Tax=Buchananella felis TaxID=3231492 RepID=UPI003528AA54